VSQILRFTDEQFAALQRRRRVLRPPIVAEVNGGEQTGTEAVEVVAPMRPARRQGTQIPPPLERDVLADVLAALKLHPRVAWAHRFNTGAMEVDGRCIRFAFAGCSDILGQLADGRFLAVEVKRPGSQPTPAQQTFLLNVARHGGCAFVARSAADVWKALPTLTPMRKLADAMAEIMDEDSPGR
jgi:hypothetical protein